MKAYKVIGFINVLVGLIAYGSMIADDYNNWAAFFCAGVAIGIGFYWIFGD